MPGLDLTMYIANIPALLIGFAFHEYAHAIVADRLGDPTPRSQGRLSLNPFVHLDVFGSLMAIIYQVGWAKPVMTTPRYFKGNPVRGRMLVAIAGPLMNLLIAFIAMFFGLILLHWLGNSTWIPIISQILKAIIVMNLSLGIFNLLPIPPLDGFSVLAWVLPARFGNILHMIESYGMLILVVILFTNVLGNFHWSLVQKLYMLYQDVSYALLLPFLRG